MKILVRSRFPVLDKFVETVRFSSKNVSILAHRGDVSVSEPFPVVGLGIAGEHVTDNGLHPPVVFIGIYIQS
jgi:hypothetical protein